jgi:hypothetical protein
VSEAGIDLDDEIGLDAKPLRAVAVTILDAALAVPAVAAHVPFARRASDTRDRIRPAHDAHHEIARLESALWRGCFDLTKRFMSEDEPRFAGRRRPVVTRGDLPIGRTYAERERAHQYAALRRSRLRDFFQAGRAAPSRCDRDCAQDRLQFPDALTHAAASAARDDHRCKILRPRRRKVPDTVIVGGTGRSVAH